MKTLSITQNISNRKMYDYEIDYVKSWLIKRIERTNIALKWVRKFISVKTHIRQKRVKSCTEEINWLVLIKHKLALKWISKRTTRHEQINSKWNIFSEQFTAFQWHKCCEEIVLTWKSNLMKNLMFVVTWKCNFTLNDANWKLS